MMYHTKMAATSLPEYVSTVNCIHGAANGRDCTTCKFEVIRTVQQTAKNVKPELRQWQNAVLSSDLLFRHFQ